jgi:hypothetical protein
LQPLGRENSHQAPGMSGDEESVGIRWRSSLGKRGRDIQVSPSNAFFLHYHQTNEIHEISLRQRDRMSPPLSRGVQSPRQHQGAEGRLGDRGGDRVIPLIAEMGEQGLGDGRGGEEEAACQCDGEHAGF